MIWEEFNENLDRIEAHIAALRLNLVEAEEVLDDELGPANDRPSIRLINGDKVAQGQGALHIEYRGSDTCPYGRSATRNKRPFDAIVLHHNKQGVSADALVRYQINGDATRGGHFGYHFYIAPDGHIIQGAPLTMRSNHVKPSNHSKRRALGRHASNANAIGVSCTGAGWPDFRPTAAQIAALDMLVPALQDTYDVPAQHIYGHGEIQTDRHETEGTSVAKRMRTSPAGSSGPDGHSPLDVDDDLDDGPLYELAEDGAAVASSTPGWPSDGPELSGSSPMLRGPQVSPATGSGHATRVVYTNQNKIRNKPCTSHLEHLLAQATEAVYGPGCTVNIYSGGQDRPGAGARRTGSIRHDDFGQGGRAADVHVFDAGGRQITGLALARLGQYWLASGVGCVGHEMRGGGIHLDEWTTPPPGAGYFWTYPYSRGQSWGAAALDLLQRGHRGEFPV